MLEHHILLLLLTFVAILGAIGMILERKPSYLKPLLFIGVIMISGAIAYGVVNGYDTRVPRFFKDAREKLQPLSGSYESVLTTNKKDSATMICRLEASGWYAVILEHSCCSGAGFDAVMIKDSEGHFYTAEKNYCGYEGFSIGKIDSLQALKAALKKEGYQEL